LGETHGSITNDCSLLVWADNWGKNLGNPDVFMMVLVMHADWQQITSSK